MSTIAKRTNQLRWHKGVLQQLWILEKSSGETSTIWAAIEIDDETE
jgi:hypothetical protein